MINWDNTSSCFLCLRTTKTDPTFRKHRYSAFMISFSIKVDEHIFLLSIKHRRTIISFLSLLLFFSPSSLNVMTPTSLFFLARFIMCARRNVFSQLTFSVISCEKTRFFFLTFSHRISLRLARDWFLAK